MKPGSRQVAKTFCVLVVGQAACLGLGVWLEGRFAAAIVEQAVGSNAGGSQLALRAMAFGWIIALQAAVAYLVLFRARAEASREKQLAANELFRRETDLIRTRDAVIFGLAKLAESRDPETGSHLERIALYSTQLAKALRRHPRYRDQVSVSFVKLIGVSSALHDIGKVGIQDSVLLKPGKFTEQERKLMETHAEIGGRCVRHIELRLGDSNFLQMARQIALAHHERWDGSGYPKGLAGESIPLAARVVAIADVYDALTSKRVYKSAFSHERSVDMICEGAGSHFDPDLIEVFEKIQNEFQGISQRCGHLAEVGEEPVVPDDASEAPAQAFVSLPLPESSPTPIQIPSSSSY